MQLHDSCKLTVCKGREESVRDYDSIGAVKFRVCVGLGSEEDSSNLRYHLVFGLLGVVESEIQLL